MDEIFSIWSSRPGNFEGTVEWSAFMAEESNNSKRKKVQCLIF